MAASNDRNKLTAGGSFGDPDPMYPSTEPDNKADVAHDGAGIPSGGVGNKFPAGGRFGDSPPFIADFATNDFDADSAGLPNVNQGEKTDMDMNLAPNMFPRQSYESKITEEEAQLT